MRLIKYNIIDKGFNDNDIINRYSVNQLSETKFEIKLWNNHITNKFNAVFEIKESSKYYRELDWLREKYLAQSLVKFLKDNNIITLFEVL